MNLFTVKQQYYTGNYNSCLQELSKVESNSNDTYLYYKCKCLLATNDVESVSAENDTTLSKAFAAYVQFLGSPDESSLSALENIVFSDPSSLYSLILLGTAYSILGQFEKSYTFALENFSNAKTSQEGYVELLLLIVQDLIYLEDSGKALKLFNKFLSETDDLKNEDEIITSFIEGYLNFNTHTEVNNGSAFYFFEDLNHTNPSYKTNLMLLNLHLQNKNLEEANSIVQLLESEFYADSKQLFLSDLLVAKITYGLLKGEDVKVLRRELLELDPNHTYCVKHLDISSKLDAIVAKYNS